MPKTRELKVTTPTDREIVITREFDAPRVMVFDALTKPDLLLQWMHGPDGWSMTQCEFDLKVGGAFRYVWSGPAGAVMGMRGVIHEVVSPERIVHSEVFDEDWTGGETLVTTLFTEKSGRTTMTITVRYASREARDGALRTGMTEGMKATYVQLDALLATLVQRHP